MTPGSKEQEDRAMESSGVNPGGEADHFADDLQTNVFEQHLGTDDDAAARV